MKQAFTALSLMTLICLASAPSFANTQNQKTGDAGTTNMERSTSNMSSLPASDVRRVQEQLQTLGFYDGTIDGAWGPMTTAAIKDYQRARGDAVTGQLSSTTLQGFGVNTTNRNMNDISPAAGDQDNMNDSDQSNTMNDDTVN